MVSMAVSLVRSKLTTLYFAKITVIPETACVCIADGFTVTRISHHTFGQPDSNESAALSCYDIQISGRMLPDLARRNAFSLGLAVGQRRTSAWMETQSWPETNQEACERAISRSLQVSLKPRMNHS